MPFDDIVPGDILVLREGHALAADGVVRWAANLSADESSLKVERSTAGRAAVAILMGTLSVGWRLMHRR